MARYEVLTLVGNDWENVWFIIDMSEDGTEERRQPETFASIEEAEAAIAEHIEDLTNEFIMDEEPPSRDEFMIREITDVGAHQ